MNNKIRAQKHPVTKLHNSYTRIQNIDRFGSVAIINNAGAVHF